MTSHVVTARLGLAWIIWLNMWLTHHARGQNMGLVRSVTLGGNIYRTDLNFEFALFAIRFFLIDSLILGKIENMLVSL